MVILSRDLFAIDPEAVADLGVVDAIVAGGSRVRQLVRQDRGERPTRAGA